IFYCTYIHPFLIAFLHFHISNINRKFNSWFIRFKVSIKDVRYRPMRLWTMFKSLPTILTLQPILLHHSLNTLFIDGYSIIIFKRYLNSFSILVFILIIENLL